MSEGSSFFTSLPIVTRGLVRHFNHRANSQEARVAAGLDEFGAGRCVTRPQLGQVQTSIL